MGSPYELSPREGLQSTYPFGCETLNYSVTTPPKHPTGGRPSQATSYLAELVVGTQANNYATRSKDVFEQYVLFPDAKSAAAEQQALEATVTPACLASHQVPTTDGNFGYTLSSTQEAFTHGGFTGMVIHDTAATDTQTPIRGQDDILEARDGSLLVLMWFSYDATQQVSYNFQTDADGVIFKGLDKLAATGH
jgi:hypothetical protein